MLSYQHGYHAGNPADLHKHFVLLAVLRYLQKKDSAIHVFDTHAGKGLYRLDDPQAQKKREYEDGVMAAVKRRQTLKGDVWKAFYAVLDELNQNAEIPHIYPGSPMWVNQFARTQDLHTIFELHPAEHAALDEFVSPYRNKVVFGDGLQGVVKALPPRTPRLLVLIDPAYERAEEYAQVADTVQRIIGRTRHAVILVWYPLLPKDKHLEMLATIQAQVTQPVLQSEWHYKERTGDFGMYGSGMLVVNPTWSLASQIAEGFTPWVEQGVGRYVSQMLVQESVN
ncbi:MAG: 23S rRNA (adenine2030-N6)-methyltransferase RimJ [Idiomarinaceae bacterium HL-53]|nr:MAG: 23S rRNA (adenine2030-N6)-methyltransferase RimJ [Idiomarinaceae bacterium HL-53]CUS47755.1 23S rRNA (adenine2030-N6)-methyltransferase [Idiomarinaceae bacterium HL-53]